MKKILIALKRNLLLLLCASLSFYTSLAQDKDSQIYGAGAMPFDESGQVVFSKVIPAENQSADNIYTAARIFITEAFNSANDVIQLDDEEKGILIAKGWREQKAHSKFMNAFAGAPYQIYFTIKLQCRDGRYKIDIYQLRGHLNPHMVNGQLSKEIDIPAELMTDEACLKPNGDVKKSGYGLWRRMVIDCAYALMNQAEESIFKNLNSDKSATNADENW